MAEWQGQDARVNRSREVPRHLLSRVMSLHPGSSAPPEWWENFANRVALEIWHEAYVAGAAHGISITHTPKYILVTEEQQAAMIARMETEQS